MSAEALERGNLPTLSPFAENKPPQPLETAINFPPSLLEFTGDLRTGIELQKAGWDSFAEIKRFIEDINLGLIKGLTLEQAVAFSTQVFIEHIFFYDAEFTKQETVLPHHNHFGLWQGEKRALGNNGRPVEHAIDPTERMGAAKKAAQKTEQCLLDADDNSFVVSMSAQGESGYRDENGVDIPHLNTYVMVDWTDQNGDLKGATLITDLTVDQAEQVMKNLGAPANFLAKRGRGMQRLANLLENLATPALPAEYNNPLTFVFDQVLAVRGEGDIHLKQKSGPDEIWLVAEAKQKLASYEAVLNSNAVKDKFIQEFRDFILTDYQRVGDPAFQQKIINMAEDTVYLFARDYRKHHQHSLTGGSIVFLPQSTSYLIEKDEELVRPAENVDRRVFFAAEITLLQSRAGCPSSRNSTASGVGITSAVSFLGESDSKGSLYFTCPVCGAINKRPWEGYVKNCQSCGTNKVSCESSSSSQEKKNSKIIEFPKKDSSQAAQAA